MEELIDRRDPASGYDDANERLNKGLAKNIRVHELAKELGMTNAEMMTSAM